MLNIHENVNQVPQKLIRQLQKVEVATISHVYDEYVSDNSFQVNYLNTRFAGTAVTVSIEDEDAAVLHYTLDSLRPNDVLVVNIAQDIFRSCWGLVMHLAASNKSISGVVINGNITDIYSIRNNGIPIAFKGYTAKIFRQSLGSFGGVNIPILIDRLIINPGDAVVVDECGIAAIMPSKLEDVVKKCLEIQSKEPGVIYSLSNSQIGELSGSNKKIMNTLQQQASIVKKDT